MADEMDPCFWRRKQKKETHEHSSESDDEPYGFGAKNLNGNRSTSKEKRSNDYHRKTDASLDNALGTKPDPGIFPYYYHREPIRGTAFFVVNQTFQRYEYRSGAEKDLIYLKSVFVDKLGFQQLNKGNDLNLSLVELDNGIKKAISMDYSNTDFFVFAISTHGEERPRGSDQFEHALLCADDQYKFTIDVIRKIGGCPNLAGKPKIFFIQACRTRSDSDKTDPRRTDKGHKFKLMPKNEEKVSIPKGIDSAYAEDKAEANNDVDIKKELNIEDKGDTKTDERDETYANEGESDKAYENNNADAEVKTKDEADARHKNDDYQKRADSGFGSETVIPLVNIPKDCLVVYAIQSRMYAWRNTVTGSWLFDELNKVMEECPSHHQINVLDILTKTAFKMAQRETAKGFKAVCVIQHKLTKDLLIPKKH
ncbi:hypothetical protein ACJMK2_029881 [Sinanodonta woodiana]|uniref:Uncharacterized protein n=1 Tax=Sinanodonta woodiana TaxID=1069815 RepID=A0ABD3XBK0_SINWO